jgi:tetratricopeptide (TPR) repeat protein
LGRTEEALKHYQDGLKIRRQLAEADPKDAGKQRGLLVSFIKLGDVYVTLGRTEEALKYFDDSLKISRQLAQADPQDAQKQRNLSVSFSNLGNVYVQLGRTADALQHYQDSLKISRQLAQADPQDAQKQRDLMVSFYNLGTVQKEVGDYETAIMRFQQGVAILDTLIEAKLLIESSRKEKAILEWEITYCQRAILATGDWAQLVESDAKQLPGLLAIRVTELAKRGRLKDVEQTATKLREWKPTSRTTLYKSACAYGLCATLAIKGKAKPSDEEAKLKQKYTDLALACLKEAIGAGFNNFDHMQKDSDLAALHDLPEFQALFPKK